MYHSLCHQIHALVACHSLNLIVKHSVNKIIWLEVAVKWIKSPSLKQQLVLDGWAFNSNFNFDPTKLSPWQGLLHRFERSSELRTPPYYNLLSGYAYFIRNNWHLHQNRQALLSFLEIFLLSVVLLPVVFRKKSKM